MHSHWTVVRGITRSQLQLFDSDGLRVLNVNDMRMSYERTSQRSRHVLIARSIFRLTRECPDKRAG